ncbi:hypothetical protein Agabi119p4_9647 [Agaricus bisporus var. burnettii]|uniref:Reverse transcriptase/retrotransposon-derived protein RNase H-like domain-containing protein n=1 Tax=Agaricus bisporus var. burnettii TaxID=192524 RepID=A0A8H7C457_AGABI|nr:hypothetical protein Agabi119p4_9647 [Agaricus bisporus var. burnettii]
MDPDKVDSLVNWKAPTNRALLTGFLGVAGYLADNMDSVCVPMGHLHAIASPTAPFRWDATAQRAFNEVKDKAMTIRDVYLKPLDYSEHGERVNLITDGCATGIGGIVSQVVYDSTKLSCSRDRDAGRSRDNDENLSPRQARWLEKMSGFDFAVEYVPGSENVLSDALSRIYSNDSPVTVRAPSEYTDYDDNEAERSLISKRIPVLAGAEGASSFTGAIEVNENRVHRRGRPKQTVERADTGRPETADEFAARMKGLVKIIGPKRRGIDAGSEKERLTIKLPARRVDNNVSLNGSSASAAQGAIECNDMMSHGEAGISPEEDPSLFAMVESDSGIDVTACVQGQYSTDIMFRPIIQSPADFRDFVYENGLLTRRIGDAHVLCVPNITVNDKSIREIIISEAHSLLAHLGARKTLDYLRAQC